MRVIAATALLLFFGDVFAYGQDFFRIDSLTSQGDGCPSGSVGANVSPDYQAFTLLFDSYLVEASPDNPRSVSNCHVDLDIAAPAGWAFGLFCVDVRGYASLDAETSGRQSVDYSLNDGRSVALGTAKLTGPFDDDYQSFLQIPLGQVGYSGCGDTSHRLTIKTKIGAQLEADGAIDYRYGRTYSKKVKSKSNNLSAFARRNNAPQDNALQLYKEARLLQIGFINSDASQVRSKLKLVKELFAQVKVDLQSNTASEAQRYHMRRTVAAIEGYLVKLDGYVPTLSSFALMTTDSIDGHIKQHYGIAWRRCQ